jgi:hypothetical protein
MLVDVSWNEVIKPVEAQLNNLLRKVKVYPTLLYSCENIAKKLRLLKTLKEKGAEPVLFDPACEKSYSIHGIERRYWRLYKLCDAYNFRFYNINNEIVAVSNISYRKMEIGVRLGERQPFLTFSTDPLILTPQEFRKLIRAINSYRKAIGYMLSKRYLVRDSKKWEKYDEFYAVTLSTSVKGEFLTLKTIYNIEPFAEKYDRIIAPPTREEEEKRRRGNEAHMRRVEKIVSKMEELIASAKTMTSSDNVKVYDIDIPSAEKIFKIRLSDVAEKAVAVECDGYIMNNIGLSTRLPLNYLVAHRILEERGASPLFMTPDREYRKMFPKPLGTAVEYIAPPTSGKLYCLLIYPKPPSQLPRIKTAKVIMTKKRIVVINP